MACLSQALRLRGLLPPHNAFQDTFLTMQDGPHRSCPRAQRVPVHPKVFPHSYLPLSRHSARMQQPQGDHLTGPEVGLRVFGDGAQLLIDLVEGVFCITPNKVYSTVEGRIAFMRYRTISL